MRLRIAVVAAVAPVLLALVLPSSVAAAAEKKPHPGAPYSVTFQAGQACDFPVRLNGIDDTTLTVRPDGSAYTQGYFDVTVTNLTNGKHVFRVASGPGLYLPGGRVLRAHGAWVLQLPPRPGHKARLILITGSFKLALVKENVYGAKPGTTVENLCTLVS